MKEVKEPEITLFGTKIVLPDNSGESSAAVESDYCSEGDGEKQLRTEEEKAAQHSEITKTEQKEQENPGATAGAEEPQNPKTPSINEDVLSENNCRSENDQSDAATENGQQKALKKPDKILPCPRCNSTDTKFCYYNNYNVNQPRHFCRSCQRYWTAGGTMRNVPVGAGRRKNKNSASHCRHITLPEALDAFKPNGTVLSFGPDAEKQAPYRARNGYHNSCGKNGDNVDENGLQKPVAQNINGFPSPAPFVPLPFPIPAICPPLYPMPFYPNPYWSIPWVSSPSSALGKHSRNGELLKHNTEERRESPEANNAESCIVVPKTLRIDDPEEAAKSSIWETLGIKYGSISREGLFKALQPKVDEKKAAVTPSSVLQANPAALSRSITFQERA